MKRFIAKGIWIGIVIISILLIVWAFFIKIRKEAPYYSYPRTEARVLDVYRYERRSEGSEINYGIRIRLVYIVDGKEVKRQLEYKRDNIIINEGDIVTVAYNPDNPSDCIMIRKLDKEALIALVVTLIFIAWMCKKILFPSKRKIREN